VTSNLIHRLNAASPSPVTTNHYKKGTWSGHVNHLKLVGWNSWN